MIQYGTVTSVLKSDTYGAQLCNIKAHLSNREYQNCEVITPKGMNYLPAIGDVVLFTEIHNSEVVILGVLESADFGMTGGGVTLHRGEVKKIGQTKKYNMKSSITLNPDYSITLKAGDSLADGSIDAKATLLIKADGTVQITCNTFEIL